uniref:Omega-crystallin n=1 Tax=Biomphalaria glabrata TaxID=6526 RepID=A0A2C9K4B2_BIOGL
MVSNVKIQYTQLFINNEFVDSVNKKTIPVVDPSTEEVLCEIQGAEKEDVDKAVAAAREAFKLRSPWRTMDASKRGQLIGKFASLLQRDFDYIVTLESLDNGKPRTEAVVDITMTIDLFQYYAGWCDKICGKTIPVDGNFFTYTRHEPIGVCGQIIPWNYPLLMFAWKVAPAIACGNTCVIKPSELTPLTALYAASLFKEAGFPAGVLNVVPGYGDTAGNAITSHMDIDKVAFTGSTAVTINSYNFHIELTFIDITISKSQFDKVLGYMKKGKEEGATLVFGGEQVGSKGFFVKPTIFADVKDNMSIATEEIFGPVQSILKFSDLDEVLERANRTKYGLAAGVITNDINKAFKISQSLQAGSVWVNCYDIVTSQTPFGGFKQSGHGREVGEYALQLYTEIKTVTVQIPEKNS